jgi:hypothetical protein
MGENRQRLISRVPCNLAGKTEEGTMRIGHDANDHRQDRSGRPMHRQPIMRSLLVVSMGFSAVLAGCLATDSEPPPVRTVTYEYDKEVNKWTQVDCTTSRSRSTQEHYIEVLCYKRVLEKPPSVLDKQTEK